ncbi:MAG: lipid-A-disaccharide synthase-related protein [Aphanocapsa sp. GSE-SYN-MK-11-07L]|jgi:uncharacterized protein (TIGR03492 family)|nr:lipid-A-disaccharide synthase-related protein [Aphanocapsa sp. GSE-SYN-MK-11-07L]
MPKLLCLSNGHGEDQIAVSILQALQPDVQPTQLAALPLVGEGLAYQRINISLLSPGQRMPSGGFIYMDGKELAKDIQHGLLQLLHQQWRAVKRWGQEGGNILAVGDIVPLLLAWQSGSDYAFVGTFKSEYYLRDQTGPLPQPGLKKYWQGWAGSDYLPWERWLMARPHCRGVFPRDRLTAETLQKLQIPAYDFGNPMMDGLTPRIPIVWPDLHPLTLLLLPGSRPPEAYANWRQIVQAIASLLTGEPTLFLAAIAPGLDLTLLVQTLSAQGWQQVDQQHQPLPWPELGGVCFRQAQAQLCLTQTAFQECLHLADLAIAMAGTATEQFVGLGKPAISMPGAGPQFTPVFAERQAQLLGPSITLLEQPTQLPAAIASLQDADRLNLIRANGRRRMGPAGAAQRIADLLLSQGFCSSDPD